MGIGWRSREIVSQDRLVESQTQQALSAGQIECKQRGAKSLEAASVGRVRLTNCAQQIRTARLKAAPEVRRFGLKPLAKYAPETGAAGWRGNRCGVPAYCSNSDSTSKFP